MANDTPHSDAHDELAELLVPYALGLLDDADAVRVQAAIDSDPALREEYAAIQATSAALVGSVPLVPAPASVRTRVFEAIGAAEQRAEEPVVAPVVPITRATGRRRSRFAAFALPTFAAVSAAACIALAFVAINLHGDLDDTRGKLARTGTQADAGFAPHMVSTSGDLASASGALLKVADGQYVLMLRNVPDPGLGKSWQVWTKDQREQVKNVAQWKSDEDTRYVLLDSDDITDVMVSLENTTAPLATPGGPPVATVSV